MHTEYKNVRIIGTSHIAKSSIVEIKESFKEFNPDFICVELDQQRLQGLLSGEKPDYGLSAIRVYGLQGYLFVVIAAMLQKKLGNIVGAKPGSEMLEAVNIAKENNKQLCLIDQEIAITLKRFSKLFGWRDKFRMVWDVLTSPFQKKLQKKIKINLHDVPDSAIIIELIKIMKDRYPGIYTALIDERNKVMSKRLFYLMDKNPEKKILAVIGAGHLHDVIDLIKKKDLSRDRVG